MRTFVIILVGSIVGAIVGGIAGGIVGLLFMLFQPDSADAGTIQASCYGAESGPLTASGEKFDPQGLTVAHRSLPFGTRLLVRHEGRGVVAVVNDRGPAEWTGRDIDLAQGACQSIGLEGVGPVEVSEVPSSTSHEKLPDTGIAK